MTAGLVPERIAVADVVLELHGPERAAEVADAINGNLDHLGPWMAWAQRTTTPQEQAMRLAMVVEQWRAGGDASWSIVVSGGRIAGGCGIHHRTGGDDIDIGYWLTSDATGRGRATAAAAALTRVAFEVLGVSSVRITCDEANASSARVAERLGFVHRTTIDEPREAPGDTNRTMVWVMEAADWPGSPGAAVPVSYAG